MAESSRLLVLPFLVVGLAGGWLTADVHGLGFSGQDGLVRGMLTLVTPATTAFLGARLGRDIRRGPLTQALTAAFAAVLAGGINGAIIGLFVAPPWGALGGGLWGLVCAIPFVPVVTLLVAASRRATIARPGSAVEDVGRRAIWIALAAALGLSAAWGALGTKTGADTGIWMVSGAVACALALIIAVLDVFTLRAIARAATAAAWRPLDKPPLERDLASPAVTDLGLGDFVQVEVAPPGPAAYRSTDRVVRVLRGSPILASAFARSSLALAAGAFAICAMALAAQIHR